MTRKVSDGQSAALFAIKKASTLWQGVPIRLFADNAAIFCRVGKDDYAVEVCQKIKIQDVVPSFGVVFGDKVVTHFFHTTLHDVEEFLAVDIHKIAGDVHFEDVGFFGVVEGFFSDVLFEAGDAVMGAAPFDAGITIGDEVSLEEFVGVVVVKVVDYAVAEVGGEDFALFWVFDDEAFGRRGAVGAVVEFAG